MHHGIEGFLKDEVIDMEKYFSDLYELSLLKRTPAAFLGSCRYKLPDIEGNEELYEKIFLLLWKYDIEYFLYIGGNDSMDTVKKLSDYAAANGKPQKFIGIPKTIDNDLPVTDHCPGYGSASKYIATTMKELICDNESFGASEPRITIVEIMGRNAGWLTASSALSRDSDCGGPDLIYLPEHPFDMDAFVKHVKDLTLIKNSIVIAVSEGIHLEDGTLVCELGDDYKFTDAFGHRQLSGCSRILSNRIARETGYKTRPVELSVLQRCATHLASRTDVDEAYNVGYVACQKALEGQTGVMITINVLSRAPYISNFEAHDVHDIANLEKKVPLSWITEDGNHVTQDFLDYVKPLVLGSLSPYYAAGLPKHLKL